MRNKIVAALVGLALSGGGTEPAQADRRVRGLSANALPQAAQVRWPAPLELQEAAGAIGAAIHERFEPPLTAAKIARALDDAVLFLRSQQAEDGSIGEQSYAQGGSTALATLALLAAGRHPASDHTLRRSLSWLSELKPDNTYVRGIRANVWEYALRRVPHEGRYRAALRADLDWLLRAQGRQGAWRYNATSRDWDNSCTQYAVLGAWAAARAGLDPGDAFWSKVSGHFRRVQNGDGGWGYTGAGSSPNMATAGLASMFLVFDMLYGKDTWRADRPGTFSSGEAAEALTAISRGMEWLGQAQGDRDNAYYLYGIERTGVASGRKYIGGEDWFSRGALAALTRQGPDGSVQMGYTPVISTSLVTLFLVYGGAPVAFNKLQHGAGQDWNLNPRDLANLTKHLWSSFERPLAWYSVSVDAPVRELEAPVLLVTGSEGASFSDTQVDRLREYVLRGGTILAEPSDHAAPFRRSMVALLERLFPAASHPGHRLAPLPEDHGVYTVLRRDWTERPRLSGASDGARTFFFLSEGYLTGAWQRNEVQNDAFALAENLLFYATDLGVPGSRLASRLPETRPAPARDARVRVARLRHGEQGPHPRDWDAARFSLDALAGYARHVAGIEVEERPPASLSDGAPRQVDLLHLTGREELRLSTAEREALRAFVAAGGTLLVDAWAGSPRFAASARRELEAVFGGLQPLAPGDPVIEGRFEGGEDLGRGVRLRLEARRRLRTEGRMARGPQLEGVRIGSRTAVVFSALDLGAGLAGVEAYRAIGYRPASAMRIATNLLCYVAERG